LPSHVRILAAFCGNDTFARVADGALSLRERVGVSVTLEPASSVEGLAEAAAGERGEIAATDLPAPPRSRSDAPCRRTAALHLLRSEHPSLPVVVFLGQLESRQIATLRRMSIRGAGALRKEDTPGAAAVALAEQALPRSVARFLRVIPGRLHPKYRLALARGVMRTRATWGEEELSAWAGVGVDRLRADFRRIRIGSPAAWRLWANLYQVAVRMERNGKSWEALVRLLGISDPPAFFQKCHSLVGGDPTTVFSHSGTSEVLQRLRRWCAWGGPRPRGTERTADTGGSPDGDEARAPALPVSIELGEHSARVEELYREFSDDVRQGAKACGASDQDANDIVQDVFRRLLDRGSDLRDQHFSRAYFRRAGSNRAVDRAKHASVRERYLSNPAIHTWTGTRSAGSERERSMREEVLRDAVRRLPEPQRTVIRLCDLEEWKAREVAELLETTEKSVEHRRARGRRRIRSQIES